MKKIISILFALVLLAAMTVTAAADSFQINTDKSTAGAGETVTVNIVLDKTITGSFRNVQGQLTYDPEILNYVSHDLGDSYSEYVTSDMPDRKYVTFTNTDFTEDGFSNLPAGSVITVTFKVSDSVPAEHLKTVLKLNLSIQDTEGRIQDMTAETAVTICGDQDAADNDSKELVDKEKTETCEKCGAEYVAGEVSDEDELTESSDEKRPGGDMSAEQNGIENQREQENSDTNRLLIAVLITAAAAGALITYRRTRKK